MQDIHHHSLGGSGGGGADGRFFGGGLGGGGGGGGADRRMRAVPHHNHHSNIHYHQALKCPRCDSLNTKFCYYNNYNLSQPRHFCKTCRRYWTKGGVLRNVPVGGGCRKAKRAKSKQSSSSSAVGKSSRRGGSNDAGEGKSSASHSSSESSSVTASNSTPAAASAAAATATTAVASEVASAPVSGLLNSSGFDNPKLYGNGIEWSALLGQGSSDGGIFAEIGSFTSLAATSSNETTPFVGFGGNSVNQQCLDQGLKVEGGGLLDDQAAVQVDFPARSLDQNVGFGPLDWGGPGGDQALFDLTSTVDHAYWSQSQWTNDQDHGGLYLP